MDVADVNGDGDLDVVATEYTNFGIGWFESDGSSTPDWTTHRIAMSGNTWGLIFAKDMDRDGDIDLVAGSGTQAAWVENDGNDPPAWTIRTLASSGITNYAMAPGDVDGDGDVDLSMGILPAGFGHQHEWWENSLGQFSLTTTSLAPATIGNGATVPVLAIDITSNARSGDSDVELADLALRVTRGNGSSLSTEAANRLIQRVRVYLDNGSSSFELGLDTLVASVDELALAPLAIPFTAGDPRVRLAAGQSKRLFVVSRRRRSTRRPSRLTRSRSSTTLRRGHQPATRRRSGPRDTVCLQRRDTDDDDDGRPRGAVRDEACSPRRARST